MMIIVVRMTVWSRTFIVGQTEPQMEAHDPAKPAHKAAHVSMPSTKCAGSAYTGSTK